MLQQYSEEVDTATQPFQFALSTRAGTGAAAILLRSISELDPETVIVCVDGVGAFDNIRRSAMLSKLKT